MAVINEMDLQVAKQFFSRPIFARNLYGWRARTELARQRTAEKLSLVSPAERDEQL